MKKSPSRPAPRSTLTVVVVDDSPLIRQLLIEQLSAIRGLAIVGEAADGAVALDVVANTHPDVVVLDIALPTLNGLSVLAEIKRPPNAPLVMILTNHALPEFRARSKLLGAEHFFDKSFEFEKVVELCRRLAPRGRP